MGPDQIAAVRGEGDLLRLALSGAEDLSDRCLQVSTAALPVQGDQPDPPVVGDHGQAGAGRVGGQMKNAAQLPAEQALRGGAAVQGVDLQAVLTGSIGGRCSLSGIAQQDRLAGAHT